MASAIIQKDGSDTGAAIADRVPTKNGHLVVASQLLWVAKGQHPEKLNPADDGVTVRFANGTTDRAPLVVGADGNGSAIRSFVFGGEPATFNGQVAFRALIPIQAVPAIVREREMAMHRGPDRYLLYYALQDGTLMNLIGCGRSDVWEEGQALQNPSIENRGAAGYGLLGYDPATVPV